MAKRNNKYIEYGTEALPGIRTKKSNGKSDIDNYPPGSLGLGGLMGYGTKKLKR